MTDNDDDNGSNNSSNRTFQEVIEARVSRRAFLGSGLAAAAAFSLSGVHSLLKAVPAEAQSKGPLLGFQASRYRPLIQSWCRLDTRPKSS